MVDKKDISAADKIRFLFLRALDGILEGALKTALSVPKYCRREFKGIREKKLNSFIREYKINPISYLQIPSLRS